MAYATFQELVSAAHRSGSISSAAVLREAEETGREAHDIRAAMTEVLTVMRDSIEHGLTGSARSRSGVVGGDAARVATSTAGVAGSVFRQTIAAALAVGEVNASMGRIVAAPTGGASGVLPAVLLSVGERIGADEGRLVDGLFTAGAIGGVIASRSTLSGAAGGCQAEIGSGAAMAAGAAVELAGGSPEQAGHAASFALQGLLGLVCDPVGGLVEVPCVARNATGAAVALAAAEMALAGAEFPIPFDEVVDAAAFVGRSLPPSLRETALGGLAGTPTGREIAERVSNTL